MHKNVINYEQLCRILHSNFDDCVNSDLSAESERNILSGDKIVVKNDIDVHLEVDAKNVRLFQNKKSFNNFTETRFSKLSVFNINTP